MRSTTSEDLCTQAGEEGSGVTQGQVHLVPALGTRRLKRYLCVWISCELFAASPSDGASAFFRVPIPVLFTLFAISGNGCCRITGEACYSCFAKDRITGGSDFNLRLISTSKSEQKRFSTSTMQEVYTHTQMRARTPALPPARPRAGAHGNTCKHACANGCMKIWTCTSAAQT